MADPLQLAKAAREQLANALNALQSNQQVPEALVDELGEPIAQAMSVLHRIERSGGANLDGRDTALSNVRAALDKTQKLSEEYSSIDDTVVEAVALALSKVHALVRYNPPAPEPVKPTPIVEVAAPAQPAPAPAPVAQAAPQPAPVQPAAPVQPTPVVQVAASQPAPQPAQPAPVAQPAPQPVRAEPAPQPVKAEPAPQPKAEPAPQPKAEPAPQPKAEPAKAEPAKPAAQPARKPGEAVVDVELGIHSASNFYKGLSGNDVIEHGGIFVATYKIPKVGSAVNLRVLLPGNYEFTASAVVQWTRDASDSVDPGFGARFTQISPDGRQLVYRYARNREPMFYDDL